jgi:hypothetical protein
VSAHNVHSAAGPFADQLLALPAASCQPPLPLACRRCAVVGPSLTGLPRHATGAGRQATVRPWPLFP